MPLEAKGPADHFVATSTALGAYFQERRRALLWRLRAASSFAFVLIAASAGANVLVFPDRIPERLLGHAVEAAICAAGLVASSLPGASRWANPLAVGLVLGINTSMFWLLSLSPGDLDVLTAVLVSVLGLTTVLFPWGTGSQALVSVYSALGFLLVPPWPHLPTTRMYNVTIGIALGVGASIIGAMILDRHRRATFFEREHATALARVKSEFVSMMSHELRTPPNVILGYAEMARDPAVTAGERTECLQRIEAAARDLLVLIENTLQIGKLEAGRDEVQLEPLALRTFWAELGSSCDRIPRRPGVDFVWEGDVPLVSVLTDPRRLSIIVRNLVGNAVKFTDRGWVRAQLELQGDQLRLRVSDTGIGIKPEDHEAIFEMYRQADGSDARRFGGTGLGLHIVRRFVEQLGGTVEVESERGRGSTFSVTLPVRGAGAPAMQTTA